MAPVASLFFPSIARDVDQAIMMPGEGFCENQVLVGVESSRSPQIAADSRRAIDTVRPRAGTVRRKKTNRPIAAFGILWRIIVELDTTKSVNPVCPQINKSTRPFREDCVKKMRNGHYDGWKYLEIEPSLGIIVLSRRILLVLAILLALVTLIIVSQLRERPLYVSGEIESDEIRLGSRVGGRVKQVLVREGDTLKTGMPLIEFESWDLEAREKQAEAELAQCEAALSKMMPAFDRRKSHRPRRCTTRPRRH